MLVERGFGGIIVKPGRLEKEHINNSTERVVTVDDTSVQQIQSLIQFNEEHANWDSIHEKEGGGAG